MIDVRLDWTPPSTVRVRLKSEHNGVLDWALPLEDLAALTDMFRMFIEMHSPDVPWERPNA